MLPEILNLSGTSFEIRSQVTDVNYGGTQQDGSIRRRKVILDCGIRGPGSGGNGSIWSRSGSWRRI